MDVCLQNGIRGGQPLEISISMFLFHGRNEIGDPHPPDLVGGRSGFYMLKATGAPVAHQGSGISSGCCSFLTDADFISSRIQEPRRAQSPEARKEFWELGTAVRKETFRLQGGFPLTQSIFEQIPGQALYPAFTGLAAGLWLKAARPSAFSTLPDDLMIQLFPSMIRVLALFTASRPGVFFSVWEGLGIPGLGRPRLYER